jgi:hypothetical protein
MVKETNGATFDRVRLMRRAAPDLTSLSDLELLSGWLRAKGGPRGCRLASLLGVSWIIVVVIQELSWVWLFLGPFAIVLLFSLLDLARAWWRGPEPHREYFLRRHLSRVTATPSATDQAECVLMLSARVLPHGGLRFVWVVLHHEGAASGRLVCAARLYEPDGPGEPILGEFLLTSDTAARISGMLADARAAKDSEERFTIMDGLPFDLEIHRAGERKPITIAGNLAANDRESHPGCRLASAMLAAAYDAGLQPRVYGAVDSFGNITIGVQ